MGLLKALIFDVDGTLAETEEIHRKAFNLAFAEAGLSWRWNRETYGRLLKVTGGRERIEFYARQCGVTDIASQELHRRKTHFYNNWVMSSQISLRPGVEQLIGTAREAGMLLAIATTTSRANVESLLARTLGPQSSNWFTAICCGEDVTRKKPAPEVYQLTLEKLGLAPNQCIAFEDSANGLMSATAAGLTTVITPSIYTAADDFSGAAIKAANMSKLVGYAQIHGIIGELIALVSN